MDEIKLRAWGQLLKSHSTTTVIGENKMHYFTLADAFDCYEPWFDHENSIIMPYIGLKDKNDKEICVGDILRVDDKRYYPVAFTSGPWLELEGYGNEDHYHQYDAQYHSWGTFEIVGNIYENPELIQPNRKEPK